MIDFTEFITKYFAQEALKKLQQFFKGNLTPFQKMYEDAFEETKKWYQQEYHNDFGKKANRFYDYQKTEAELAKLLFVQAEPDLKAIEKIKFVPPIDVPSNVILAFVNKFRENLSQIRELEAILAEKEKFRNIDLMTINTSEIAYDIKELVKLLREWRGTKPPQPPPNPIAWSDLYELFTKVYRLDQLDYGHLGTQREQLEFKLELEKVYIALNVKHRSFEKLMTVAQVKELTLRQQQNLPLLIQRLEDLSYIEEVRSQRKFKTNQDMWFGTTLPIAQAILKETNAQNLRSAQTILKEILANSTFPREETFQIIWDFCNWGIKSIPLANVPKNTRCHLIIGDAGSGKSTASRYIALRCFQALQAPDDKMLADEFDIKHELPLPVYLRLEDFGKLIDKFPDGKCCLCECAANFWRKSDQTPLFKANQLAVTMKQQPVWLFLDGLDELSNPDHRLKLVQTVRELVESGQYPNLRITLTSRPAAITDELLNGLNLPYFHLLELEPGQVDDFAHRYFAANLHKESGAEVKNKAEKFLNALQDVPAAQKLSTNPLLLTVISVLHYKENKLPESRADLYDKCIEQLMAQKAATPGKLETGKIEFKYPRESARPSIDWKHTEIKEMLRDLAFHAFESTEDEVFLTPNFVLERFRQSEQIPPEMAKAALETAADEFLDNCDRHIGILAFRGGHYVFIHRTFQEYLAAHWLSLESPEGIQKRLIEMFKQPAHWWEVILLFFNRIGYNRVKWGDNLIKELANIALNQQNPELIRLAARCLAEFEESQQRYRLHEDVKILLETRRDQSHQNPQLFLTCGDALALMHEPKILVSDPPMIYLQPDKPFIMGLNKSKYDEECPAHPVQLSPFWIGQYPVTNQEFAEFIKARGYETETYWFDDKSRFPFDARDYFNKLKKDNRNAPIYWLDEKFGKIRPLAPVVGVTWYEAMAYCRWWTLTFGEKWAEQHGHSRPVQMRLPTEAEWEFAARGFDERLYPWGNEPPALERVNYHDSKIEQTTTVGSYPAGKTPEEIFDLAGNVWEWCYDGFDEKYYEKCQQKGVVQDPVNAPKELARVLRGGSWLFDPIYLRAADRFGYDPSNWFNYLGFRCSRAYA